MSVSKMKEIDEIVTEFYSQYGMAMHFIQTLESGLIEYYAIYRYVNENLTELEYYEIIKNHRKPTLGQLIEKFVKLKFVEIELEQNLKKANTYRIFLAHRFWWDRDIEFNNPISMVKLHDEISSYIDHFKNLVNLIDNRINRIRTDNNLNIEEKMGFTNFSEREYFIKNLTSTNKKKM